MIRTVIRPVLLARTAVHEGPFCNLRRRGEENDSPGLRRVEGKKAQAAERQCSIYAVDHGRSGEDLGRSRGEGKAEGTRRFLRYSLGQS